MNMKLEFIIPGIYKTYKAALSNIKDKSEEVLNNTTYDLISLYSFNEDFDNIIELKTDTGDYFKSSIDEVNSHQELDAYLKALDLTGNDVLEDNLTFNFNWD